MNRAQMVVLRDNVVVFCIEDKERFGNEQNKKKSPEGDFKLYLILRVDFINRDSI